MKNKETIFKILMAVRALMVIIFVTTLAISLYFILWHTDRMTRRVMFFYNNVTSQVEADEMAVKIRQSKEDDIKALVSLMLAPPKNIEWHPIFANEGVCTFVSLVGSTAYVSMEGDVVKALNKGANFKQDAALIERTLYFNFPFIKQVVLIYNGYQAF